MSKSLVCLCHFMGIITLLNCAAGLIHSVHNLRSKAFLHSSFGTLTGISRYPAQTESLAPFGAYFKRNLIGCAAHTASLYLKGGHNVFHCGLESLKGIVTRLFLNDVKRAVNDLLRDTLFSVIHDVVDKARYKL